jgi:hypothetical protein
VSLAAGGHKLLAAPGISHAEPAQAVRRVAHVPAPITLLRSGACCRTAGDNRKAAASNCRHPAVAIAELTFGKLFRLAKICRLFRLQPFFRAYRLYRKRAK